MGDFFQGFGINDALQATLNYNQQRIDGRIGELRAQSEVNGYPSRLSNPNARSDPATQTEAGSWIKRNGMVVALVAVAGLVVWKVMR